MLFNEIIPVYSKNHAKPINTEYRVADYYSSNITITIKRVNVITGFKWLIDLFKEPEEKNKEEKLLVML
jgi:hypothetical protein